MLQPLLCTLTVAALLSSPEFELAHLAGWLVAVFCFVLFLFSVRVVQQNLGKRLYIELTDTNLSVPGIFTGRITTIPLAQISEAKVGTIDAEGVKFHSLHIKVGRKVRVLVHSQLTGDEIFDEVCLALEEANVHVVW